MISRCKHLHCLVSFHDHHHHKNHVQNKNQNADQVQAAALPGLLPPASQLCLALSLLLLFVQGDDGDYGDDADDDDDQNDDALLHCAEHLHLELCAGT